MHASLARSFIRLSAFLVSLSLTPVLAAPQHLEWSSYLGGDRGENGLQVARDAGGGLYVAGSTSSPDFPVTAGAYDTTINSFDDAFVAKIDPLGSTIVWATFLGGSRSEDVRGLAVGPDGDVYVCGRTTSSDLPVTAGAFDTTYAAEGDAWVARVSASGTSLVYATYLGGVRDDVALDLVVGSGGEATVVGYTRSADYPSTPGAFDPTYNGPSDVTDGFVTRLNSAGTALLYSTFVGGTGFDGAEAVALDEQDHAYVTGFGSSPDFPTTPSAYDTVVNGHDAYVLKLDPTGSSLIFSTMLGTASWSSEKGSAIFVDALHRPWVAGITSSYLFPVTPDAFDSQTHGAFPFDSFVSVFDATGSTLLHSTVLGGAGRDAPGRIAQLSNGDVLVTGETESADHPTTAGAYDRFLNGGSDGFVCLLDADLSRLRYGTYLGGLSSESLGSLTGASQGSSVLMPDESVVLAGATRSVDFPITPGVFDPNFTNWQNGWNEGFVTRMRPGPVLKIAGTPAGGQSISFEIDHASTTESGDLGQVLLSCSGTAGIQLPSPGAPLTLPLTFDGCTSLSIQFAIALQASIDASGHGTTPATLLPTGLPVGVRVFAAALTIDPIAIRFHAVTPPIDFVTQ